MTFTNLCSRPKELATCPAGCRVERRRLSYAAIRLRATVELPAPLHKLLPHRRHQSWRTGVHPQYLRMTESVSLAQLAIRKEGMRLPFHRITINRLSGNLFTLWRSPASDRFVEPVEALGTARP